MRGNAHGPPARVIIDTTGAHDAPPQGLALAEIGGVLARAGDVSRARQVLKHANAAAAIAGGAARVRTPGAYR
jgi:hypothetical protein